MARPANQYLIPRLKAAINAGIRPSSLVVSSEPVKGEWSHLDKELTVAYQILQDETCPMCGHPVWYCRNQKDITHTFVVKKAVCIASKELKKAEFQKITDKDQRKDAYKQRDEWGAYYYTSRELHPALEESEISDSPRRDYFSGIMDSGE